MMSDNAQISTGDDGEPEIETLVAGRAKRATAGNRLNLLLEREGDDELELLFAENEEEEDVEFEGEGVDAASDVELGSSDDDDQSSTAGGGVDELEGEKEIQRQYRLERKRKRKAQETFKRPRPRNQSAAVDSSGTTPIPITPLSRVDKKKSERLSWLPTPDDGPVRSSSRRQTVQNKQVVYQRLEEGEKRRRQQLEVMEAAAERRKASKPKAMSQADRIAEAARTERQNAKSLNRWEAEEKKRAEEQKAKLDALKTRKLEGPVITWWSGTSKWVNGRLVTVETRNPVEEVKDSTTISNPVIRPSSTINTPHNGSTNGAEDTVMKDAHEPSTGRINPVESLSLIQDNPQTTREESTVSSNPMPDVGLMHTTVNNSAILSLEREQFSTQTMVRESADGGSSIPRPLLPVTEIFTRNLIILENVEVGGLRVPEMANHVLLKRRTMKLPKAIQETCPITGLAARFRDPKTGLVYHDAYAYKEIQKACNGKSRWSNLLGCYVGPATGAARGVPESFLSK